ncbi:MAG: ABC transporter ATP-binding protein, partial [Elusimicrobia bacterium]|nr:ABC transporter ATP-binding protein [Elusimicrobiota bacterium]
MKRILRLVSYGRKYWPQIVVSVLLMAIAGASQGLIPLLIPPIFDRVLLPNAPDGPIALLPRPLLGHQFYLDDILPFHGRSVWTMVATALLCAFFLKGLCDYIGNYLVSYAGFASVTRLRNQVFEKVLKQGAEFFEAHSTGQLMSSIMNDVDKVQVATSQILADLL